MNEKKPPKILKVFKSPLDLFAFLHGQAFKQVGLIAETPAEHPSDSLLTIPITLHLEPCEQKALVFALQAATSAGLLDPGQYEDVNTAIRQLSVQLDSATRTELSDSAAQAATRHKERLARKLFKAAEAAPSRQ